MVSSRKTRRPSGHREEPDGPEPETTVRTFLYREDAQEVADKLGGWSTHVQYLGSCMRWVIEAKRKSWPIGRFVLLGKYGEMIRPEDSGI